jgi:voltage-gated potassium channel
MPTRGIRAYQEHEVRRRIFDALNGRRAGGLTRTQQGLVALIVASIALTVLGTEPLVAESFPDLLLRLEVVAATVFAVEYLARVWVAGELPQYAGVRGRLRYMRSPLAMVDLIAIAPFVLGLLGAESMILRTVRLVRLVVLARLARFSRAIRLLADVIHERRFELGFTVMMSACVILIAATALYVVEGAAQPEAFGSVPRAAWWAVTTLTTVGYGDAIPQTLVGRLFGMATAFAGIGLIALPTGILAAAMSDALARVREGYAGKAEAPRDYAKSLEAP